MSDSYVNALLTERHGYVRAGLVKRVAAVDAVLAGLGIAVDDDRPETATNAPPERVVRPRGRPRKMG